MKTLGHHLEPFWHWNAEEAFESANKHQTLSIEPLKLPKSFKLLNSKSTLFQIAPECAKVRLCAPKCARSAAWNFPLISINFLKTTQKLLGKSSAGEFRMNFLFFNLKPSNLGAGGSWLTTLMLHELGMQTRIPHHLGVHFKGFSCKNQSWMVATSKHSQGVAKGLFSRTILFWQVVFLR